MQVQITGKNLNIGQALPQHITEELRALVDKYFRGATDARVVVEKTGETFKAEIQVHVNKYIGIINAHAMAGDAYSAFANAMEHAAKRLRRKKRQNIDKHRVHHYGRQAQVV